MNDTPGWASPGSAPSDDSGSGTSAPQRGGGAPEKTPPGDRPSEERSDAGGTPPPNWSPQQPPAGRWAAPTGTGRGPTPPPGGNNGWDGAPGGHQGPGQGWGQAWGRPVVAKPGIIPLRPLGVGEILDGAVSAMRAHWRTVLGISLAVAVVTQTVATIVTGIWFSDATGLEALESNPEPTPEETLDALGGALSSSGVTSFIAMLGTIVATAMLTMIVSRAVLGRPVSTGEAWRGARPQLLRLFGLLLLLPLLIAAVTFAALSPGLIATAAGASAGGAALTLLGALGALVFAVWLWIRYSLAAPALMLEKQGVIAAMRRSAKLVRGAWWRVFGIQILTTILVVFVAAVIEIPTSIVALVVGGESAADWFSGESTSTGWTFLIIVGVGAVISSTVTFPISAGVTALLYMDQRIRREALDLELGRAAGLPEYGAQETGAGGPTGQPREAAPGS